MLVVRLEEGAKMFPELAPGSALPISPDRVVVTPKEAAGS